MFISFQHIIRLCSGKLQKDMHVYMFIEFCWYAATRKNYLCRYAVRKKSCNIIHVLRTLKNLHKFQLLTRNMLSLPAHIFGLLLSIDSSLTLTIDLNNNMLNNTRCHVSCYLQLYPWRTSTLMSNQISASIIYPPVTDFFLIFRQNILGGTINGHK